MMRSLSTLCVLAAATAVLAADDKKAAEEKSAAKIQVTGLVLRKPAPAKPGSFTFTPNGVTMDLAVSLEGKFIAALDSKDCKLEGFTDDKKNNLIKKGGVFAGPASWIIDYMTQYSPEGDRCTLQVTAGNPPGKGAEKILVKGSLHFRCGTDEKTTEKKDITLKMNEEVSVGDFKMKVNNAGQFAISLSLTSPEPNVKSVAFLDADGKEIKANPQGRGLNQFAPGGKPLWTVFYGLPPKIEKASFKVTYFNKLESVTVPLDLRVGLDLE